MPEILGALWWDDKGVTREVILTKRYALKIPKLIYGWRNFLQGLLANMQEVSFCSLRSPRLCPIVYHIPGGWLVVMRRATPLTEEEWDAFDPRAFCNSDGLYDEELGAELPVEHKIDSFGKLDGKIVAVDYGN